MFDSDAKDKIDVRRAENRLARMLTEAGAVPYIVRLPSIMGVDTETGKELKTGLDDYLLKESVEAFLALVEATKADVRAEALNELAAEVVYLSGPDIVYCPEKNLRMNPVSFVNSRYANRHYMQPVEEKPDRRISTAKEFMTWEARPELDNFTFVPGGPEIIDRDYNLWPGWPYEPKKGDVRLWREAARPHIRW